MPDEGRVRQLLEEMLDGERTPEEVCADDPDLLPEVRARWARVRSVKIQLDELFPCGSSLEFPTKPQEPDREFTLPQVDGYDVEAVLGRGGMGVVFKARQLKPNRPVALKMLLAGVYASPQELARFLREIEAVATLRHPNIVQIYEVSDRDRPYFTMELVEGGNLAQHLAKSLPPPRGAAELVATLAVAVQFAHKSGIIHRDLKPANILLTAPLDGEAHCGAPKIADFGLARFVNAGPELTLSGVRLGTPGYMAPEQALGMVTDVGPAVDVYALGVILYEALTGRPPFEGPTPAEAERRVISEEPTPPSRAGASVPRDLQTICLKCLHKNPARRYASAQDLADDLYRFLDGKPVLARPVGALERAAKWARRHPVHTVLASSLLVVLATMLGVGVWVDRQEHARRMEKAQREQQVRHGINTAIEKAYESARVERWGESRQLLAAARGQLDDANSDDLRSRVERAEDNIRFAQELDRIRLSGVTSIEESQNLHTTSSNLQDEYAAAFARAGFAIGGDARQVEDTAARIRSSPLSEHTVAALDQWAFAAFTLGHKELLNELLQLARIADPDATWRDRFRDAAGWRDASRLRVLVADARKSPKSPAAHQLGIVNAQLRELGEATDEVQLFEEALRSRPDDFWLNWEMASSLVSKQKHAQAIAYLRVVVALRPHNQWAHVRLGLALVRAGAVDPGIAEIRSGQSLAPDNNVIRWHLVMVLDGVKRPEEAMAECRQALKDAPADSRSYFAMARLHQHQGKQAEAVPLYRKAIELDPKWATLHNNLGGSLYAIGQFEEAAAAFRRTIELEQGTVNGRVGLGRCYQILRRDTEAVAEFRKAVEIEDSKRTPAAGTRATGSYLAARQGLAAGLLNLDRIDEAVAVAKTTLELTGLGETQRKELNRHLSIGLRLLPMKARLPALLAGKEQPADAAARLTLAEWLLWHKQLPAASARHYQIAFQQQPGLVYDLAAEHRFNAAQAAALAGCGFDDGAKLNREDKAAYRKLAREWLRGDFEVWKRRYASGAADAPVIVAQALAAWQNNGRLEGVFSEAALRKLPEAERKEWQRLWADVKTLTSGPVAQLREARVLATSRKWAQAAELYARAVRDNPADHEIRFEHAAVQLLAGDRDGYRQTCKLVLERAANPSAMRPYLAARVCTLAPESVEDQSRVSRVCAQELQKNAKAFWSLTEQGALQYRANQYQRAVQLFEESLRANTKPGNAVLNWLWLAMAHHRLNHSGEARYWLERARVWLDSQEVANPSETDVLGLHIHNWLEAHVLRREAEMLILSAQKSATPNR